MRVMTNGFAAAAILFGSASWAVAQQAAQPAAEPEAAQPAAAQPAAQPEPDQSALDAAATNPAGKLVLLFPTGSATLDARNVALLDKASRLYREGRPIVMVVSGSSDSVGDAAANLKLSQRRANAVEQGLLARGIPAERTEILAKGETSPAVAAPKGTAEAQNRRVEIGWR